MYTLLPIVQRFIEFIKDTTTLIPYYTTDRKHFWVTSRTLSLLLVLEIESCEDFSLRYYIAESADYIKESKHLLHELDDPPLRSEIIFHIVGSYND